MTPFTLHLGDCLEALRAMPANSVDSIVTDPPYGLTANKKGGSGVASVNIKSPHGRARIGTGNGSGGFMGMKWDSDVPPVEVWAECLRVLKPGGHLLAFAGTRTQHRMAVRIEDAGFEIRDMLAWVHGQGFPKSHNGEWGGTALKPALEPITFARKPLIGTVYQNWRAHGTGAINVDGCRVPFAGEADEQESKGKNQHADFGSGPMTNQVFGKYTKDRDNYAPPGRWPANLIHDGSEEVAEVFGDPARFFYCAKASKADRNAGCEAFDKKPLNWSSGTQNPGSFQSEGTDRAAQNNHPTVKPTDLMRYLCRLVTPPGGVVLDPFMGSGSTGKAAMLEGFHFIGCELSPEYMAIAEARIGNALERAQAERAAAETPAPQRDLFEGVAA